MPDNDRYRASYSHEELRRLLAVERLVLVQKLLLLKGEIRERVGQIERIERRLADIDNSEARTDPISWGG
ncbi:MAG TPA: hypothetical protein VGI68_13585 [Mycobacterium sp.]